MEPDILMVLIGRAKRGDRRIQALIGAGWALFVASVEEVPESVRESDARALVEQVAGKNGQIGLDVDLRAYRASWLGQELRVSPTELRLLGTFCTEPGRAWTFQDLGTTVLGQLLR
jgi:DNA-binding response OmpR family regulator